MDVGAWTTVLAGITPGKRINKGTRAAPCTATEQVNRKLRGMTCFLISLAKKSLRRSRLLSAASLSPSACGPHLVPTCSVAAGPR